MATPAPLLSDGVVLLRPFTESDRADLPNSGGDLAAPEGATSWAITQPPGDQCRGVVYLHSDDHGAASISVLVTTAARHQGLATRSLRLVSAWGFNAMSLQVITGQVAVGNEAARRAAIKAGFRVPDVAMRRALVVDGHRHDAWVGDMIPADLQGSRGEEGQFGTDLTRRERDVLARLTLGESNRAIATTLGISENTVKNHVGSILEKLQASSRAEAVVIGLRHGLTSLDN